MPEKGFLLFEAVKWEEFILKEKIKNNNISKTISTALFIIPKWTN